MSTPGPFVEDLIGELIAVLAGAVADSERRRRRLRVHANRDGRPRCRHRSGTRLTSRPGRVTCRQCLRLMAGAGCRRYDVQPCGTPAAYRRHRRNGEKACRSCLQAISRDRADRKAARQRLALLPAAQAETEPGRPLNDDRTPRENLRSAA